MRNGHALVTPSTAAELEEVNPSNWNQQIQSIRTKDGGNPNMTQRRPVSLTLWEQQSFGSPFVLGKVRLREGPLQETAVDNMQEYIGGFRPNDRT